MEAAGIALAVAGIVGTVVSKLSDISSDYKSAFPELRRVETGLKRLRDVLDGLEHGNDAVLRDVLKDLEEYVRVVEAFADVRLKKLVKRPVLVKLRFNKDRVTLEKMQAALETYKTTLLVALQVQRVKADEADRSELVAELKVAMEQAGSKRAGGGAVTEYELGSQKIQDIRAFLESVSNKLGEGQTDLAKNEDREGIINKTEVGKGGDVQTWPTYEAWMNSFSPSSEDIAKDEAILSQRRLQRIQVSSGKGEIESELSAGTGTVPADRVNLVVENLTKGFAKPISRTFSVSPNDDVADVLEILHGQGFTWVTGFTVDVDRGRAPLIGPIVNQCAGSMVSVTDGASCYDASAGYRVNVDEPLIAFFNRTVTSRRPPGTELSVTHNFGHIAVRDNYRTQPDPELHVKLMRTVRVPEDGVAYNLPQDFGPFPILKVEDFQDTLPPGMMEKGGVFIPMLLREALFVSFVPSSRILSYERSGRASVDPKDEGFALRVFAGRANVISASDPAAKATPGAQDYIVVPKQERLDGFPNTEGVVRQFNAMSVGSRYAVEAQVSGSEVGGLQLQFAPRYKRNVEFRAFRADGLGLGWEVELTSTPRELKLEPGSLLVMTMLADPNFNPPRWTYASPRPVPFDGWGFREPFVGRKTLQSPNSTANEPENNREVPKFKFPSDAHGEAYQSRRPDNRQPKSENLQVGHWELARAAKVSDIFAAARTPYKAPLTLQPVRPLKIIYKVSVFASEVFTLEVTASPFEDAFSFRQRVKELALLKLEAVAADGFIKRNSWASMEVECDPTKRELERYSRPDGAHFGYLPLHEFDIYRKLRGDVSIRQRGLRGSGGAGVSVPTGWTSSLAAGGSITQTIRSDRNPRLWNWEASRIINIQILDAVAFRSATGLTPPIPAISFEEYTSANLPFLSYYSSNTGEEPVRFSPSVNEIQTTAEIDQEREVNPGVRLRKGGEPVICIFCEHRLCDSILLPCRHVFCSLCIKMHMTRRKEITCSLCYKTAKTIQQYAAASSIGTKGAVEREKLVNPVARAEVLLKNHIQPSVKPDDPDGQVIHRAVLRGTLWGHRIGDEDWSLMMSQVIEEWDMGQRSEEEIRNLANSALDAGGATYGKKYALEVLFALAARIDAPGDESSEAIKTRGGTAGSGRGIDLGGRE